MKKKTKTIKDVRLQVYVTSSMDDQIEDVAEIMGLTKSDFIRYALSNAINAQNQSLQILREIAQKELEKQSDTILD